jgi:hypothetical protein
MVAINSIPQHDVAKGNGQMELDRARPTTLSIFVAKKPGPSRPAGAFVMVNSFDIFLILNTFVI